MHTDEYPCPCGGCDRPTLDPDEYCVTCMHHGCGYEEVNCNV